MESINNRYVLQEVLGEGGMGVVYHAVDRLAGRAVALKRVFTSPNAAHDGDDQSRLILAREFQALASLRHPNIISVLDYGFDQDHVPFFTMELLEQPQTILRASEGAPLLIKIDLLAQMLRALMYVHRQGILHRDLKPGNVLVVAHPLTGTPHVKVLDFGLSIEAGQARGMLGTLTYMAPEIILSQANETDTFYGTGIDLFAVGVLAYQMFVGRYPFPFENIETLMHGILHTAPDFAQVALPAPLIHVIERLLAKHPADRYSDAGDAIRDLRTAVDQPMLEEDRATRESILQAAKFVGRGEELRQLEHALDAAAHGQGGFWLIGGESGVGKSRLLDELMSRALIKGMTVLRGQGIENGGLPYQLWRDPLRQLILSIELDDLDAGTIKPLVPDIAALLQRPIPDAPAVSVEASQQRLLTTILRLFKRYAGTTLLVLEDLQWVVESLEPLKLLAVDVPSMPLLIVASYRHEESPALPDVLPTARSLFLKRLDTEAITALSASMLGDQGRRKDVIRLLENETEGNVFFLVEVVRALAQSAGSLTRIGQITLPDRVFTGGAAMLVRRRLERVPHWCQGLLQRAAVAGRLLDLPLLTQINRTGSLLGDHDLDDWLIECAHAAVLDYREGTWRFAHDKVRETLLDSVGEALAGLNREVAVALEAIYTGHAQRAAYAEMLRDHWQQAGDFERELHYTLLFAEQAIRFSGVVRPAHDWLTRALTFIDSGAIADDGHQRMKLLHLLGTTQMRLANYRRAAEHYEASMTAAEALNVSSMVIANLNGLAELAMLQTNLPQALTYAEAGLRISREIGDLAGTARCLQLIGQVNRYTGDLAQAREQFDESLRLYQLLDLPQETAELLSNLGTIAFVQNDFTTAKRYFEESYAIVRRIGDRVRAGALLYNLAMVALDQLDYADALDKVSETVRLFREIGNRQKLGMALTTQGAILLRRGDFQNAQAYFHESLTLRQEINDRSGVAATKHNLGISHYLLGNYAAAEPLLHEVLVFFQETNNRLWMGQSLRDLGLVAWARGDMSTAQTCLLTGFELFDQLNDARGMVFTLSAEILVQASLGAFDAARANLARAVKIARDTGQPTLKLKLFVSAAALALAMNERTSAARWISLVLSHPAALSEDLVTVRRLCAENHLITSRNAVFDLDQALDSLDTHFLLAAR